MQPSLPQETGQVRYALKDQIVPSIPTRHRRLGMGLVGLNIIYLSAGETSCRKNEEVTGKIRKNLP
jgi:hypothetical protein